MKHPPFYFHYLLRVLLLSACCILSAEKAWAVACNAIFTNGIQATGASGTINLSYHSILTGGSANLTAKTLIDNTAWVACSGSSCAATGTAATTSAPTFSTAAAGTNISIGYQGSQTVTAGNFGTVNVGQEATLRFNTASGVYRTKAFLTGFKSILELQSGDYWIDGNLTIGQETILRRIAASGTTRIFVNGSVTMDFKVATQNFTSSQLLIYATGSFTTANEVNLNAFVYAGGNVSLNFKSVINGGVSGANFTASGNEVTINYQPSALTSADFAPFCSGAAVAPVLLGAWRMDELSWNGTAGEVIDSSGRNNHGRARIAAGSTALPSTSSGFPAYATGAQSTCRYGVFDGTTNGVTRTNGYVELSGFPTLPNGFTFAAWIRSSNASAQHQRILVRDDADNGWGLSLADGTGSPSLRFFNRNVTNNGAVTGQGVNPNCGVFCVDTNPVIANNTWYYVAAAVDTTAKTVTLYVYSQVGTLQAKAVGAYSGTWVDGTGTVAIGGETVNSAEGRQTSFHFLGNIDEVNMYSGALPEASIKDLLPSVRTCPAPDHYELVMSTNNLACLGADVTVRACADSISPCTNIDYTVNGNVNLVTDAGSLNTTTLNLVSGSGTTKLFYPAAVNNALAKVTLSGETTIATNARKCCLGGACSVSSSCTTTFNTAGFIFPNSATGTSNNISNQIAGVASPTNTAYVRALQTNATTGACMARFTSPQTVKMAYKCVNPSTCSLTTPAQTLMLNDAVISANANSVNPSVYSDVNLSFDANGSASIPINYSDVGQIKLLAQVIKAQTPTDPAITLVGESNLFVVKPHSVVVSAVTTVAGANNPEASAGAGLANNFVSAGTPFKVSVQALNELKKVTPNFGRETSSQSEFITLVTNSLVYPSPGLGTATELTYTPNTFSAASAGTYANPTVVWPQVGSMTIMPGLSNYLGAGSVTGEASSTIGRFYPDHYRVVPASSIVTNGCGSFSYMGQPNLQIKPYITAHSAGASGVIVSNYDNQTLGYGSPSILAAPVYAAQNSTNGTNHGSRLKIDAGKWVKGVYSDTLKGNFTRQATGEPEPPYDSLRIGISAMADLSPTPFDLVNPTPATLKDMLEGNAIAFKDPSDATKNLLNLRYGRLRLDDASGPETVALPVNFITEYWTGSYFSLNTNDSCTQVPRAAITYLPKGNLMTLANFSVDLTGGTTQGTYTTIAPTYIGFNAGSAGHMFTAPTNGAQGKFVVNVDLTSLPWLGFDWNQNGNYLDADLLKANYEFGSYRGNDRVIYWREKLQ
jgi:hypothetical protein